jgi:ABC-type methionine transport system permease subunit
MYSRAINTTLYMLSAASFIGGLICLALAVITQP